MKIIISPKIIAGLRICVLSIVLSLIIIAVTVSAAEKSVNAGALAAGNDITVVLDAGHGGIDGGTSAKDGTLEKSVNLDITRCVESYLKCFGISTVLTRNSDESIHDKDAETIRQKKVSDIKNRLNIVEATPNSVLVSIHQNYFTDSSVKGSQVFYSKNNKNSKDLAELIREKITVNLQPDNNKEIKECGSSVYLMYHTTVPAVMIECGFMSNADEAAKLKDFDYQQKIAFLIACGVAEYIQGFGGDNNGSEG